MFTNVTLIFFLLLIPLAGFIAWAGDRIGHKSGKRRQSLLGLRPRHTAMVFTIGSGMAIAIVSFGLFYALSETFRVVLRDGAKMYRYNVELKGENQKQARSLDAIRKTAAAAQEETARYNNERQQAEQARNAALAQRDAAIQQGKLAETRAKNAQTNYLRANDGRKKAQDDLGFAKTELTEIQRQLREKTIRVHDAQNRLRFASSKVQLAEKNAKEAERQFQVAATDRDAARKDVKTAKEENERVTKNALRILRDQAMELNGQIAKVTNQLDEQNKAFAELQAKTDIQRSALTTLTTETEKRRAEYDRLVVATDALRRKQITYQVGEEVERISLRSGYSPWRLQGMVRAFLNNAAKKAERRGAKKGSDDRAVDIASDGVFADGAPLTIGGKGDEDDAIRAAAETIRKLNQEVVVLAVSRANAVVGEPVSIDLRIYRNPVVLLTGEKISEGVISSDGTRQETANALAAFMSQDVHTKLVGAGMLPVSRGGESDATAGETGRTDSEFTLNGEDWLKLVEDVRRAGTAAKVQVFAAKDMRAGDPIALKFTVREQPSEQAQK